MSTSLPATERVKQALREHDIEVNVAEFPQGTRTAQQAADAIGVAVGQIVKSLVFYGRVICSSGERCHFQGGKSCC